MEIYLVRHTTPNIEKGICYGQSDIDITADFDKEASEILRKIPFDKNTAIYASPLQRCTKLAKKFNPNFLTNAQLMELDFGDWELKNWNEIPSEEMTPWMKDFVNVKVPNGESYTELSERSISFFDALIAQKNSTSIVICHAGVMRSILAKFTNTELKDSFDIKISYGQVSKISIGKTTEISTSI